VNIIITNTIMKTLFFFLFTYLLNTLSLVDKNIVYKQQLRGIIEKERNRQIQKIINFEYEYIYNQVLQETKIGNTKIQFKIFCFHTEGINDNIFNSMRINNDSDSMLKIVNLYKINSDSIVSKVIEKLKLSFPDSNIIWETKYNNENDCINYSLFW